MRENLATAAGRIVRAPELMNSLYGRRNLYRAYAEIQRRSGISDTVILIFSADAIDSSAYEITTEIAAALYSTPAAMLAAGTDFLAIGAAQTMRNGESGQIDTFIYCDYICAGYAEPQNDIALTGTLERAPIFRSTPKGKRITDMLVRIPSKFESTFYCLVPVIAWNKTAEAAAELEAGDTVEISGRLQSREYTKRYEDGREEQRTATEISAYHFIKKK